MDLQEIKKQLPSGAIIEIAKRANTAPSTVCQAFKGKVNSAKKIVIMNATAEYLSEFKAQEREAMEALQNAMSV